MLKRNRTRKPQHVPDYESEYFTNTWKWEFPSCEAGNYSTSPPLVRKGEKEKRHST